LCADFRVHCAVWIVLRPSRTSCDWHSLAVRHDGKEEYLLIRGLRVSIKNHDALISNESCTSHRKKQVDGPVVGQRADFDSLCSGHFQQPVFGRPSVQDSDEYVFVENI